MFFFLFGDQNVTITVQAGEIVFLLFLGQSFLFFSPDILASHSNLIKTGYRLGWFGGSFKCAAVVGHI